MKKLIYIVLLALLIIPAGVVLAGEPITLELEFRNRTGGVVSLDMVDANGNHIYTEVPEGVSTLDVVEGKYSYYANTACGVETGVWNMNVKKVAIFKCQDEALFVDLDRMCYWEPIFLQVFNVNDFSMKPATPPINLSFNNYPGNFSHTNGCLDLKLR